MRNLDAVKALALLRKSSDKTMTLGCLVKDSSSDVVKFLAQHDIVKLRRSHREGRVMVQFQSRLTEHVMEEMVC